MKIAAITDIGSCRQENQDNYCAQQLAGGTAWGIVCDGMGGVNGGRIAARIATDTMQQYFARHMKALQPGMEKTFIMRGFDITNRAVYEKSTSDPEMQGMGTTGVCAYASRGMAHVVHAGDSRAYLFHAGGLRQITRDHSMVQQLVDSGQITREQAAVHPQKNLIPPAYLPPPPTSAGRRRRRPLQRRPVRLLIAVNLRDGLGAGRPTSHITSFRSRGLPSYLTAV